MVPSIIDVWGYDREFCSSSSYILLLGAVHRDISREKERKEIIFTLPNGCHCPMPTAIQRKGCLVVRLLCSVEYFTSQPLCVSLASAVVGALAQWKTEPQVEVEVSSVTMDTTMKNTTWLQI